MFDRLMRRPVFAETDRIMREDIDRPQTHQRAKADRRARIIGEDEEGAAIGNEAAMQRDAVERRRHAEFADAEMNIAAGKVRRASPTSSRPLW